MPQQDPWAEFRVGTPQQGPSRSDPVIAPADPYKQAAEQRARQDQAMQAEAAARAAAAEQRARQQFAERDKPTAPSGYRFGPDGQTLEPIPGGPADKPQPTGQDAVGKLVGIIDAIDEAYADSGDNKGWGETGFTGGMLRNTEGTAAYDLAGKLKKIDADSAFSALQKMREESPTGGALGQITERELGLLKSTVANLDPNLSQEEFVRQLGIAKGTYLDMLRRIDPEKADEIEKRGEPQIGPDGTITYDERGRALLGIGGQSTPPSDGGGGGGNSPYSLSNIALGIGQGMSDIVKGAAILPGAIINPVGQALYDATGYGDQRYDVGSILSGSLGLPDNPNQMNSAIIQGGAAALTGGLAARGAAALLNPGTAQAVAQTLGRTPIRDTAAGMGAGAGSIVGRESGVPGGEYVGALAGGLAGYAGANRSFNAFAPRTPTPIGQAATDLNVTMMPADVGGVGTRMASGAVGRTLGGIPMAEGAEAAINSASAARTRIADNVGTISDATGAGQALSRGEKAFETSSAKRASQLYEAIPVAAETKVALGNTREALTEITAGFRSNPELSQLWANHPRLKATLEALTPTDNRAQGQVRYAEATDRLRKAEMEVSDAKNANLSIRERQVVAGERLAKARQVFEGMDIQTTPAIQLSRARNELQLAQREFEAARSSTPDEAGMKRLEAQIGPAKNAQDEAFIESRQMPMGGELSWQDMKRFRTIVGEIVGQPSLTSDGSDIAALRKLYGALSRDMEATAAQSSPRALQAFRRADQYWRGREGRIEDVFATIFGGDGKRSPEAAFQQINSWAQSKGGDFGRLSRAIRSLPEDEAGIVRATIIQRMGLVPAGRQAGAGEVFSPATFSAQWQGLSARAKAVLFPNRQHRQDLDKLAMLTDNMKRASQFENFSNTSLGVNATAQGALAISNLPAAVTLALGQFGAGKLLASPAFARRLASLPARPTEQAARKWTESLGVLATREPLLAAEIREFQRAVNDNFASSAAAGEQQGQQ